MPLYRLYRMKEDKRQQFRWAPHTSGVTQVKPKDFDEAGSFEAENAYCLWTLLRGTPDALQIGDLLELPSGELRIFKFVGLEEAKWVLPEVKTGIELQAPAAGGTVALAAGA